MQPLKAYAFGAEPEAVDGGISSNVEYRAVIAPGDVPDGHACLNAAEVRAVRRKDMDATRPGGKQVASLVDLA